MLSQWLRHVIDSDALDWKSWLHCRVLSKVLGAQALDRTQLHAKQWQSQNAKTYSGKLLWRSINNSLDESTETAWQTISPKPWTAKDPRCCNLYCRNKFDGRTGVWIPRHVVVSREKRENIEIEQKQWWRNGKRSEKHYCRSDPQSTMQKHLEHFRRALKNKFVVCSEECCETVETALKIVYVRNLETNQFEVILGVDKLRLIGDKDSTVIEID